MSERDELSAILITSPCPSMPALTLINHTLESLQNIEGLENFLKHTFILMDGYKFANETRFKKGRIDESHSQLYDEYHTSIQSNYGSRPNFTVLRSSEHLGFAMMVKWGLEMCQTKFALILQHDRYFQKPINKLPALLQAFNEHENLRYVGFTTGNSHKHDLLLRSSYKLDFLTIHERISVDPQLSLQPLIFWFDSQHIAHVKRYLEIFKPNRFFPVEMKQFVNQEQLNSMVLRKGDFIEDRFGQAQRNIFLTLPRDKCSENDIRGLFKWFGSYLYWEPEIDACDEGPSARVFVSHLNGRSLNMSFLDTIAATYGVDRITSRQHRNLVATASSISICDTDMSDSKTKISENDSYSQIRLQRRESQQRAVSRLVNENGLVVNNNALLEEAMQFLQFDTNCSEKCSESRDNKN